MAPIPTLESSISTVRDTISNLASSISSRSPVAILPSSRTIAARFITLTSRQNTPSIIPTTYSNVNDSLAPGTIAGIVLGSVGGFLLILYLIYTFLNLGTPDRSDYTESVVIQERRKSRPRSHRNRVVRETVEVRRDRSRTPVRIVREEPRTTTERIVVEEHRETRNDRASRADSDEVVVIEEHSPPRRARSKRESRDSRDYRRDSGYRTVDPGTYGGTVGGRSDRRSRR